MTDEFDTVEYALKQHVNLVVAYKTGKVFIQAITKTGTKFLEDNAADIERELLPMIMTGNPLDKMLRDQILHGINERFVQWADGRRLPI